MDAVKRQRCEEINKELQRLFDRYGVKNVPAPIVGTMEGLLGELQGYVADDKAAKAREGMGGMNEYFNAPARPMVHPEGNGGGSAWSTPYTGKSVGDLFVESPAYRDYEPARKTGPSTTLAVKALLDTTGWTPETIRLPRVEPKPFRELRVLDVLGIGETGQNSVTYMEETTATNAAAETAEGGSKPESELVFTEQSTPVRDIATVLPVTNQLMEDVAAVRDYVNARLIFFVNHRMDGQALNGDGVAPNLKGILNVTGIQTQAKGTDPAPDAILKAMDKVRVTAAYEPDAVMLHPNDWQTIRLLRTADGLYIWGNPSERGPGTIWGLPVVATAAIAQGTALVGAFRQAAMVFFRSDMSLSISDSHSDFFIKNKLMIRAEIRVALAVFRASAFCTVTGL